MQRSNDLQNSKMLSKLNEFEKQNDECNLDNLCDNILILSNYKKQLAYYDN